jgi:hypothetical protein
MYVVADQNTGNTERIVHLPNQSYNDAHRYWIQADKRLVINQDIGVHHHRPGQCDAARHAA